MKPEIMPVSFKFWPSWRDTFPILHSTSQVLLFLFTIFLIQFLKWFDKVNFRNNHNEFHGFTWFYYTWSRGLRQICVSQLLIIVSFFQSTASPFWVVNYKNKMLEFICKGGHNLMAVCCSGFHAIIGRLGSWTKLMMLARATTIPQINDLIGRITKNARIACATGFLVQYFEVACQTKTWNFHFRGSENNASSQQ